MVSSTFSFQAVASLFSVMTIVNAHMIMKSPVPYGRGVINNSPLANDGSDFPCKGLFEMTDPVKDVNHLVPGVANTLSFTGSAVHGGGSCQVALTTDLKPTKNSKWMVIKSIEGGCPANVPGNLPEDPNGDGASKFQYTVPEGFPTGSYTIAWTWFNKIGNREMYMNCGRAEIGAAKKRYAPTPKNTIAHRAADYPDIFKANLDIFATCKVPDSTIVAFPNPGSVVEKIVAGVPPVGCGGSSNNAAPSAGSVGSGSSATAGGAQSSVATAGATGGSNTGVGSGATATATATANAGQPTATGGFATATGSRSGTKSTGAPGVFASNAASQSAGVDPGSATAQPTAQATATATATVAPISQPSATAGGSNGTTPPSTGSNAAGSPCSEEGAWLCAADGKSFQRCASGMWSASMPVAAGTSCTPGQSMNFNMAVGGSKSSKRDLHYHRIAHRRAHQLSS